MRWNILILLVLLLAGAAAGAVLYNTPPQAARPAMALPVFELTAADGAVYSSDHFKGKVLIVNFWASWCAPCVVEFPHLLKLAADNRDNVVLLALSSDSTQADMQKFLSRRNIPTKGNVVIALDSDGAITRDLFKTYKLPETFIFDANGLLAHKMIGADWTAAEVQTILNRIIPR